MTTKSENFPVHVEERKNGNLAILSIRGLAPNNTLTKDMLLEFTEVFFSLEKEVNAVLVTSSHEKFFSNGLDGKALLEQDNKGRLETVTEMIRLFGNLIRFPKPWLAELTGYTMAGGAVIASAADYRYMLSSGGRIGFSELQVGLPLPLSYILGIHRIVEPKTVRSVIEGIAFKPLEALEIGLIDGIAEDRDKLRNMCLKRIDSILKLEQASYLGTRNLYRQSLLAEIEKAEPQDIAAASDMIDLPAFERAIQRITQKN